MKVFYGMLVEQNLLKHLTHWSLKVSKEIYSYKPPKIQTSRLVLRALEKSDKHSIYEYAKNPNVSLHTLWEAHRSLADTEVFLNYVFKSYADYEPEAFGIEIKNQPGKVIGTVGCFWVSKQNECMELAYALAEEAWGKGLACEAAGAILKYVFENFSVNRIQCRCKSQNKSSLRVMQKLGFKEEGVLRDEVKHRGRYWDMIYTAMLRKEYEMLRQSQTLGC